MIRMFHPDKHVSSPVCQKMYYSSAVYIELLEAGMPGPIWGLCSRPVYLRFAEHLADIKSGNIACPVGRHWQEPGHTLEHLEFMPVEKLGVRDRVTLRMREGELINRTGVLLAGLNLYR